MLTRPDVSRPITAKGSKPKPRPRPETCKTKAKAKAENGKVNFPVNAKVNPVFQFQLVPGYSSNNNCNKICKPDLL